MLDASNVVPFPQAEMTYLSNHPPTFDDEIAAVLRTGTLVVAWDRVKVAVHDPRVKRRHLRVLVELLDCLNASAGTAWPSREVLAARCDLSPKVVENVLYDLRALHYVAWERRAGPSGGRRLIHYTVPLSASAVLKAELEHHLKTLRAKSEVALGDLDNAIRRAKQLPPPLMERKSTSAGGKIKTPPPLVEKSPPMPVEKTPPPLVRQELTYEPTNEKRSAVAAQPSADTAGKGTSSKREGAKRATRLQDGWVLPKSWGEWALEQFEVSPEKIRVEAQRFKDHWIAKGGKDAAKIDWFATWRNWCGSDYRSWKRRKPMTNKIAPDLLAQSPAKTALSELDRDLAEARRRMEEEDQ